MRTLDPVVNLAGVKDPHEHPTLIDEIIVAAQERGEFDDLPGAGKPIPGAGKKDDDLWWFRSWLKRNRVADPDPTPKDDE